MWRSAGNGTLELLGGEPDGLVGLVELCGATPGVQVVA